jgi:hypothetical protein
MKNYLKYLKENPVKLVLPLFIIIFTITINTYVNIEFTSLALSLFVAFFTLLINCVILLQVWGEYKGIEGFKDTIKQFFK